MKTISLHHNNLRHCIEGEVLHGGHVQVQYTQFDQNNYVTPVYFTATTRAPVKNPERFFRSLDREVRANPHRVVDLFATSPKWDVLFGISPELDDEPHSGMFEV